MWPKQLLKYIAILLVLAFAILLITPSSRNLFLNFIVKNSAETPNIEVGKIILAEGKSYFKNEITNLTVLLKKDTLLSSGQLIWTEPRSKIQIKLIDQTIIELEEKTQILFELRNSTDSLSNIIIHIVIGNIKIVNMVTDSKVLFLKEGKLLNINELTNEYRPQKFEFLNGVHFTSKNILKNENSDQSNDSLQNSENEQPPTQKTSSGETLTNSYIEQTIGHYRSQFQKCQINSVREAGPFTGQILIGFTIPSSGITDQVKIIKSTLNREQLENCVLSAFRLIRFQEFKGESIQRTYPLTFN